MTGRRLRTLCALVSALPEQPATSNPSALLPFWGHLLLLQIMHFEAHHLCYRPSLHRIKFSLLPQGTCSKCMLL